MTHQIAYCAKRTNNDDARVTVRVTDEGGQLVSEEELAPRLDLRNHSPTGFEWGYGGSGPAQLALAICAHATGDDERALSVYQRFKDRFVASRHSDDWSISRDVALAEIKEIERVMAEAA